MRLRAPPATTVPRLSLVVAALLAVAPACSDPACREGTLFVELDLGAAAGADALRIDISGAASGSTTLPHKAGEAQGGIEVNFPAGYPAGKSVTVVVTALKAGDEVAIGMASVTLDGGCAHARIVLGGPRSDGAADAGPDGATDVPAGDRDDAPAPDAPAPDAPPADSPKTDLPGDAPPADATTGDVPPTEKPADAIEAPPVDAAKEGPACTPAGPEKCLSGIDEDCDGKTDCADTECMPGYACVPSPMGALPGTTTTLGAGCPAQFGKSATDLHAGLDDGGGCMGCDCTPGTTVCTTEISCYATAMECATMGATGKSAGSIQTGDSCTMAPLCDGTVQGMRTGPFTLSTTACMALGSATRGDPTWKDSTRFCAADATGGGCATGETCVPRPATTKVCVMLDGLAACPAGTTRHIGDLYTGYSDTRTCGACTCMSLGGSCSGVYVSVGSDWSCGTESAALAANERKCFGVYSPPAMFKGSPSAPTCSATSPESGLLAATGAHTVCCQ